MIASCSLISIATGFVGFSSCLPGDNGKKRLWAFCRPVMAVFFASVVLLILLVCAPSAAMALDRGKNIDQYGHDVWTSQNGLPSESVYQILQTPDGYLWLRTSVGLVRFDGARFVLMDVVVAKQPVKEVVRAICVGAEGNLLIRTTTRTIIYKNGVFSDYMPPTQLPGKYIRAIFETEEHEILVGLDGDVFTLRNKVAKQLQGYTGRISSFSQDAQGTVWICAAKEIYTYRDGKVSVFPWGTSRPTAIAIDEDRNHNLLVGTTDGIYQIDRSRSVITPLGHDKIHGRVNSIQVDRDGNVWIATNDYGLFRLSNGQVSQYHAADGLAEDNVLSLLEDREGGLWVGTAGSLEHFHDTPLTMYTTKDGLLSNQSDLILEAHDGSLYVFCQAGGLTHIKNGVMTPITKKNGLPNVYGNGFFESKDGSVWIGTGGGLSRYKDGKITVYPGGGHFSKHDISAISEDDEGLIVTNNELTALRFKDGVTSPYMIHGQTTPVTNNGLYTYTIYKDSQGTLWFGTSDGFFKFAKGEPSGKARQKQIDFEVISIMEDHRGNLWLGGHAAGVTRFRIRDGQVTHYTKKEGLFDDFATTVLVDDDDNLWVSSPTGIYMVSRQDLDDYAGGRIHAVRSVHYGTEDGMKVSEASIYEHQPGGVRTHDGRLWFATTKGLVVIDPKHILHNDLVPPVAIEEIVANGVTLPPEQDYVLQPGNNKLEFHYTGLSFMVPGRVQFKYKLEGYDQEWVNAGTRRVAYYTNLPPGEYRFRVIASNNDGLWNEVGDSVAITLKPHFYQTFWFYGLCVLVILLCSAAGQRIYTRQLRRRAIELEHIVDERTKDLESRTKDLESQRAFLRNVIDISPDLIYVKDRESRFTLVNKAIADIHGVSVEQLIGKTSIDVMPGQEAQAAAFQREDREVLETLKEKVIHEKTLKDSLGRVHYLQTVKRPIPSPDGKFIYILGVSTDITEHRQAESQLRLQAAALEAAANAIVITRSSDETTTWVNPAFTKLTGYTAEEVIGKKSKILDFEQQPKSFYAEVMDKLRAGQSWGGEVTNRKKNGDLYVEELVVTPLIDASGKVTHYIAIIQDVTEQKELARQLVQAQKMEAVGKLAGGIAHDFNNMMQVILGHIDILCNKFSRLDPHRKRLGQMRQAAMRSAALTQQLLAFSRRQVLSPVVMDLNAAVADTKNMLIRLISEDIKLVINLQPGLGHVKADPTQIEQILMNLAVNARDAMPSGGTLTINTANEELDEGCVRLHADAKPGSYVMLEVCDTGAGIDKKIQAHIFEPFFTTKELGKGTGLGLSTVYGIVKQSGGSIWIYSEPGHGTSFHIYLPRVDEAVVSSGEEKVDKELRGTETILVVEDNAAILELACETLEACGYTVLTANSPGEAIHLAEERKEPVSLLITDVVMPGMSGPAVAEKLMAIWPSMRVLYMSGYTNDIVLHHGANDSGQGFLQKPFTMKNLTAKIRELLEAPAQ